MKLDKRLIAFFAILAAGQFGAYRSMGQASLVTPTPQVSMEELMHLDPAIKRTFVPLSRVLDGALYQPVAPGDKSHIGIFLMHSDSSFITYNACTEMSKRGYIVLCASNSGGGVDKVLLDAKLGVSFLRQYPGIQKVVLYGPSGGGTLMTAYQSIAENGVKVCQGAEKIVKCPNNLAGLPRADGIVLDDAHWGNAEMYLFDTDPAVINEQSGMTVNPDLDLWNPRNGFNPKGSDYGQEFIHKFQSSEGKRNNDLTKMALNRLAAIEAGKGRFADDEPFTVPGGSIGDRNVKLFTQDTQLLSHTQKAWPLLHGDGSITTEIVHSVRLPKDDKSFTPYLVGGANNTTVRTFLANSAIRVTDEFSYDEDSLHGIDWTSSYSSVVGNVQSIGAPLLIMGKTAHWCFLASETIYEHANSSDKSVVFVEGADHDGPPCKECEKTPGQFGDTLKASYDYIDNWLSHEGRFLN